MEFILRKYFFIPTALLCVLLFHAGLQTGFAERRRPVEAVNCGALNSETDDFAPAWNQYEQRLYFNSEASGQSIFYKTRLLDSLVFSKPIPAPGGLNQTRNNQSYISFLSADEALISTFRQSGARPYLNIFKTYNKKNAWTKPVIIDSLATDCFCSHPTASPDGSFMIFSSNMNSEYGDTDLWMARLQDAGGWGSLVLLEEICSAGNEITPFLATDDSLYFATNGHEGPGGYDIFISVFSDDRWQRPSPLSNINTEFDESDITVLPGGLCIFASNRPGGKGGLDLYISGNEKPVDDIPNMFRGDIVIESLVSSVKATYRRAYTVSPVIGHFLVEDLTAGDFAWNNVFKTADQNDGQRKAVSVDEVYYSSPALIAQRMKKRPEARLFLAFSPQDGIGRAKKELALRNFYERFLKKIGAEKERLVLSEDDARIPPGFCRLTSNAPEIFAPRESGRAEIALDPPLLEIFLKLRRPGKIKKWNCALIINGKNAGIVKTGVSFPAKFTLDLTLYKETIWPADSMAVVIIAWDINGASRKKSLPAPVFHVEIKEREKIVSGEKTYEQYFLFLPDKASLKMDISTVEILRTVAASAANAKKIIVQYLFNGDDRAKEIAGAACLELQKALRDNTAPIALEYKAATKHLNFSTKTAPYIVRILIEKK